LIKPPDPRVIFALVIVLSSYAVIIRDNVIFMGSLLLFTLIIAVLLGVSFSMLFGRLKRMWQVLIFVALLRSIFAPSGNTLIELFNITLLTSGGIVAGLLVLFRLSLFIASASMLTLYSSRALIQGMVQIRMPYELAYMISVGIRFVPQLAQELKDSLIALQLRGVVIEELKFKKRLFLYSYLLLPILVLSLQNAKELAMSMEMRAFRAMDERTSYYTLIFSHRDFILFVLICIMAIAIGLIIFWM